MKKLHTLISHIVAEKSKRSIAVMLKVSRHTIDNYLRYLKAEIGKDLSPLLSWDEDALNRFVTRQNDSNTQQSLELLFPECEKELSKVGMTRMILWERYCFGTTTAINYSRFCHYFRLWQSAQKVTF